MERQTTKNLLLQIEELKNRLAENEQLIEVLRAGKVDPFAVNKNNQPEVSTLQSGDYAFRVLVENLCEGALNLSEAGLIVYTNTSFHKTLKLSYEKVIGQHIFQFIHPDSKETFDQLFKKGLAGQSKGEIILIAGKKSYPVYVSLTSLYPTLPTLGMIVSDLTEIKQAKKNLEAYTILQNQFLLAPAAIAVFEGPQYRFIMANQMYEKQNNRQAKDLLGKSFREVFPELEGTGSFELFDSVYTTGETFTATEYAAIIDWENNGIPTQRYFNFSLEALKNESKEIFGVMVMVYDITSQVEARKKNEENEKQFKDVLLQSPNIFLILESFPEMIITFANEPLFKSWGRTIAIIGKPLLEVLPEIKDQPFPKLLQKVFETGEIYTSKEEKAVIIKNGVSVDTYFAYVYQPIFDTNRKTTGVTVMATDITEQFEARKKIEESEKKNSFLLKLNDAIRPLSNPVEIEEAVTKFTRDFIDADWCLYGTIEEDNIIILRDAVREDLPSLIGKYPIINFTLFKAILDAGRPFIVDDVQTTDLLDEELKQLCIQLQNISFINVPVIENGKPVGLLSIVQSKPRKWTDTEVQLSIETAERTWAAVERAKANEALRKSEEKYRFLFTSIDQGFVLCELVRNKEGKGVDYYMLELNPTYERQTGLSMEMVLGKTILQVFPTIDTQHIDTFAAVVDNQCPVVFEQYFEVNHRWHEVKVYPGEQDRFTVLFSDISERKLAEEKIIESESRFRTMADASPVLIWTLDANGLFSYYNKTFLDFIGVPKDADIDWASIVHPDDVQFTFDSVNRAMNERSQYSLECRMRRADGQWRWVLAQGNPSIDTNNKFLGFVGSSVDITERKQAEAKIKESEEKFRLLVLQAPVAICVLRGENYVIETINEGMCEFWDRTLEQALNKPAFDVLPDLLEQGIKELLDNVYKTGERFVADEFLVNLKRNGEIENVFVKFVYEPMREADGNISGVMAFAHEITEQVIARKQIEESESLFRLALALTAQTVFKQDTQLRYTWIYNTHPKYAMKEILGKTDRDLLDNQAAEILTTLKQSILKSGKTFTGDIQTEVDGKPLNFAVRMEATKDIAGKINGIIAVTDDITERIQAENKIKQSEQEIRKIKEQLELSIQAGKIGLWHWDAKNDILTWSKEQKTIYGVEQSTEITNIAQFQAFVVSEDWERLLKDLQSASVTDELEYDFKIIRKNDGEIRWIKSKARNILDQQGGVEFISGVNLDITDQVRALNKIKESEERFRNLAETLPQMVWVMNADGTMEYGSKKWKEYSGIDDVMEAWNYMMYPADREKVTAYWNQALPKGKGYQHEVQLKNKEGIYRWFYSVGEPVFGADEQVSKWVGSLTDIHEQKLKEERKDEFISIASHELKTPLTTAKAYLQMLELTLGENDKKAALYAKKASLSVNRLNELISELLDVSKIRLGKLNYTVTTFNFNEMIDNTVEILQLTSSTHNIIKTGKIYNEVTGDKNRLQQVMINLLTNAIKYSPGTDKVLITVEETNDMIKVSVKDSGIGISKASLKKIFDKYHRIEEHAVHFQGLGIGLFISYEIIQRHHGKLWADSEQGIGSTFYFTLPIYQVEQTL